MSAGERGSNPAGAGMAGGAVPSGKENTAPTGPQSEPIRVPVDDQERLPMADAASEESTGTGDAERRHDALEGEGAMEPPGWSEE